MLKFIFKLVSKFFHKRHIYLVKSLVYDDKKTQEYEGRADYIRIKTLELCARQIKAKDVKGSVAEVGVYKGQFAALINENFPDKSLYLFDTFEGFSKKDIDTEKKKNFSTGEQDFSDTSVEMVLSKMPFKEKCIVKKGFFPETAEGMNETFCFVSIDTDLYEPIYASLVYFYDRLEHGGYIFIDDFTNFYYKGAQEAVNKFCNERGITPIPMADVCGGAIISK